MKKSTSIFISFFALIILFISSSPGSAYTDARVNDKRFEFVFQPLDFLLYGPTYDLGIRVVSNLYIDAHFRWSTLGLLYLNHYSDMEGRTYFSSSAAGGGLKYLFLTKSSPHCPYIYMLAEYGWGGTYGGSGLGKYETRHRYISVLINAGYRWRFDNGFLINLGAYGGFQKTLSEKRWYKAAYSLKNTKNDGYNIIGTAEFALGVEF